MADGTRYTFFDHTADIGIRAHGPALADVFLGLARGLTALLVEESRIGSTQTRTITVAAPDVESLLLVWLQELLFFFSTERFVPVEYAMEQLTSTALTCRIAGGTFDPTRHLRGGEAKAITRHWLEVRQENGVWRGQVIVDI